MAVYSAIINIDTWQGGGSYIRLLAFLARIPEEFNNPATLITTCDFKLTVALRYDFETEILGAISCSVAIERLLWSANSILTLPTSAARLRRVKGFPLSYLVPSAAGEVFISSSSSTTTTTTALARIQLSRAQEQSKTARIPLPKQITICS